MEWYATWLLAALVVAGPTAAADTPAPTAAPTKAAPAKVYEPAGFGAAKFGASLAEVWKMHPKARLMGDEEQGGAPVVEGPYIDRLLLSDEKVPGFEKPTKIELRFWKGRLWAVIIYFGDNDPVASQAFVRKTFGPPTIEHKANPMWQGEKVTTSGAYDQNWYGSSDNGLSKQAQTWFSEMFNGVWKGETPEEKAEREKRMAALTPKAGNTAATTPTPAVTPKAK